MLAVIQGGPDLWPTILKESGNALKERPNVEDRQRKGRDGRWIVLSQLVHMMPEED